MCFFSTFEKKTRDKFMNPDQSGYNERRYEGINTRLNFEYFFITGEKQLIRNHLI